VLRYASPIMQSPEPEIFHAKPRRLTRAEYDKMAELGFFRGERVELIHGIAVRMPPIGSPHAEIVDRLTASLVRALGDRARVRIQSPFLAADDSEPEPDVAIVPAGNYARAHPDRALLLIEVAETSLKYDRETKTALYAASAVPEFWIVDVAGNAIEVYSEPVGDRYARVSRLGAGERVQVAAFPDVVVVVSDLFD